MSLFIFTRNILEGKPIDVFNYGKHRRDFTYIDDITTGVVRVVDNIPRSNTEWNGDRPDPGTSSAPYRIYNIGNHNPVELMRFIELLEENLGKKAIKNFLPMQPGDVHETYADVTDLINDIGYSPWTPVETGIRNFVIWYKQFYRVK